MSEAVTEEAVAEARRPNLFQALVPSVVSGIVLGVVGAAVAYFIVAHFAPQNYDAQIAALFTAWALFFLVGIGAFNDVFKWGFARHEAMFTII